MPQHVTAAFTERVVERLNAAGLVALVDREVGPGALCIELLPGELLAFVDLQDAAHAVTLDQVGTLRLVVDGPFDRGARCDDARCVSGALVEWTMRQRTRLGA